jgi:four helix bundle protein
MQNYRNLLVWQKGHQLAIDAYQLPPHLLNPEAWPLRDQLLRSAISIPSNVAEGSGRSSDADCARFLWNSVGSCNEFESQLLLGHDLKFIPGKLHARLTDQVIEVRRMLNGLIGTLK